MMDTRKEHIETLQEIRSLMERSSRFISLSGLSGVAAGISALLGAAAVFVYLEVVPFMHEAPYYVSVLNANKWGMNYIEFFFLDALLVLIFALAAGTLFTIRKAKKNNQAIWDATSQRLLINLLIPLVAGGLFCLLMLKHRFIGFIAPTTLIFYGLALVNASKYTLTDIRYLGYLEIVVGLIAMYFLGYGLEFWAIGFGILHIIYGTIMYFKYERKPA